MIKIEAITLEEAYQNAASSLECSVTELKIEVVQYPSKGLLGLFKKSAVIVAAKDIKEKSEVKQEVQKEVQEVKKEVQEVKIEQSAKKKETPIERKPLKEKKKPQAKKDSHTRQTTPTLYGNIGVVRNPAKSRLGNGMGSGFL